MAKPTPAAEVEVTHELVRELLNSQFAEYAGLELRLVANGWDNAMFRLGKHLAVRLPRRALAAPLIVHEQQCLPGLARVLPLAIPAPIAFGKPDDSYPWHWSIVPWIDGEPAATSDLNDSEALVLAGFLSALHQPAPTNAPENRVRGIPLAERSDATMHYLKELADVVAVVAIEKAWNEAIDAPVYDGDPVWLHGDLHPLNIIVDQCTIKAVVDFGDVTSGDPATDLSVAFALFNEPQRAAFRAELAIDDDTWMRARGWAVTLGMAYIAFGSDNPVMTAIGHKAIKAALGSET